MGFLKKVAKTAFDAVTIPIAVAADLVTFGGINVDKDTPYTVDKLKQLADDWEEIRDALDD